LKVYKSHIRKNLKNRMKKVVTYWIYTYMVAFQKYHMSIS